MFDDVRELIAEGYDDSAIINALADDADEDERMELMDVISVLRSQGVQNV